MTRNYIQKKSKKSKILCKYLDKNFKCKIRGDIIEGRYECIGTPFEKLCFVVMARGSKPQKTHTYNSELIKAWNLYIKKPKG
jgi:uncharacterized protein VirK/YbjX